MKMTPLAVIDGARTPFCKAYGALADVHASDLGTTAVSAAIRRSGLDGDDIDEVILGNVSGPADSPNIARVVALKAGIPHSRVAHTVNRNCASGLESVITAWQVVATGRAEIVAAGGTESMSGIPLLVNTEAAKLLTKLNRAKSVTEKLRVLASLRPRHLKPIPGVVLGLTDPVCGLNMGQTAENLAAEFSISRAEQDAFALESHLKAAATQERCFLSGEIEAIHGIDSDDCIRTNQTTAALQKLRPVFASDGTVTPGNSCPLTDGAAALILTSPTVVRERGMKPLGYVTAHAVAGCEPARMGLGPVFATAKLLRQTGLSLEDFDLIEINEAFAAQVLACLSAFESESFAKTELTLDAPLGSIPRDRLNVHGGAIALGHPVGTTGTRMILTLLRALRERGLHRGLATLCVGGGQGVAVAVETELSAEDAEQAKRVSER